MVLTLAAAALLSISNIRPIFDSSVQPGGLVGTLISRGLASGLNTVGATVLLIAVAATGLLLATNFSFVGLYEKLVALFAERFAFVGQIPARFRAWREARREQSRLRKEQRELLKAQEAGRREQRAQRFTGIKSGGTHRAVHEGRRPSAINAQAINLSQTIGAQQATTIQGSAEPARAAAAGAGYPARL